MIVRTIEILLEYLCILLCLHYIAKKKMKIDFKIALLFTFELIIMQAVTYEIVGQQFKMFVHISLLVYTKYELVKTWNKAVKVYGIVLIVIMTLQIAGYYILRTVSKNLIDRYYTGTLINVFSFLIIYIWTKKYNKIVVKKINSMKYLLIVMLFLLVLFRILSLCIRDNIVDFEIVIQFGLESIGLYVASMLWINSENQNKHRMKELQMYELYNNAFEEMITSIRIRQHEFENHINAIKCMQYTIKDQEILAAKQEEYCNKILQENELNKLLKKDVDPILIGFIYSKIISAQKSNIKVKYNISCIDVKGYISLYEIVEVVGILFDNAVEALETEEKKIIVLKVIEKKGKLYIEVANNSRIYKNNEIEQFTKYGYSTKNQKRGVGLNRVKDIAEKSEAEFLIRNMSYEGVNYLSFMVKIEYKKEELF